MSVRPGPRPRAYRPRPSRDFAAEQVGIVRQGLERHACAAAPAIARENG
jgi:hypothetical protein